MRLERLAPLAFVAGIVLFGLGVLALTLMATAPGHGPVEDHETTVVGDQAVLAYPVPVSPHAATRIDLTFEYPQHAGTAMIVGCSGYSALLQGQEPDDVRAASTGGRGSLSSATAPDGDADSPSFQCPFRYAVFQWGLRDAAPSANRPDVTVETSPVMLTSVVLMVSGATAVGGLALAFVGGTTWARRLQQGERREAAGEEESTSETLLLLIDKTGDWLRRTRHHLVAAGVLGVFLWYPVVLPWAWNNALRGSPESVYPWLLTLGALALLATLTVLWAREYLRIDRELVAWRERMDRLHDREARLLADLETAG